MPKQVAVINDLSGFGRCSLTVAISVLSSMGVSPCSLPTAVLTAQTGYDSYHCVDLCDYMPHYIQEWQKLHAKFDGIYTGFVASEEQIRHILEFVDVFQTENTFLLVDPVLGDDGQTYDMFTPHLLVQMQELVCKADYITPNLTELCLLCEINMPEILGLSQQHELEEQVIRMARTLLCNSQHMQAVVVTGLHISTDFHTEEHTTSDDPCIKTQDSSTQKVGNLVITQDTAMSVYQPLLGGSYSGTGDFFASILTGAICNGVSIEEAVELASSCIQEGIRSSMEDGTNEIEGINYEKQLGKLYRFCDQDRDEH